MSSVAWCVGGVITVVGGVSVFHWGVLFAMGCCWYPFMCYIELLEMLLGCLVALEWVEEGRLMFDVVGKLGFAVVSMWVFRWLQSVLSGCHHLL